MRYDLQNSPGKKEAAVSFGEWLQAKMQDRGIEQGQLAAFVGKSPSTISRWITGSSFPNRKSARALAKLFKVDPEVIDGFAPEKNGDASDNDIVASPVGGIDSYPIYPTIQAIFGSATRLTAMLMEWGTDPENVPDVLMGIERYVEQHGRPPAGVASYDRSSGDSRDHSSRMPPERMQPPPDEERPQVRYVRPGGAS